MFSLALGLGACTIHRHYHTQAPQQPDQVSAATAYNDYDDGGAPGASDDDDQPIPPSYARPAPYSRGYSGGYSPDYGYSRTYDNGCDCSCDDVRVRRRPMRRRLPMPPRQRPRPVTPDNPVDWLE